MGLTREEWRGGIPEVERYRYEVCWYICTPANPMTEEKCRDGANFVHPHRDRLAVSDGWTDVFECRVCGYRWRKEA